tara:strand:+ start:18416 stop:18667 length:252 start_codon:yes stop_codon:yes gene_type:complete
MANSWIEFVKAYASKNKMKYNEALKDPKLKIAYNKSKGTSKGKKGAVSSSGDNKIDDSTKKGGMRKTARKAFKKGNKKESVPK